MKDFSHYSEDGRSTMVDIAEKPVTSRTARAEGFVQMKKSTLELLKNRVLPKGDAFEVARIAGIMSAKKTPELIPMCHQLNIEFVDVKIVPDYEKNFAKIESEVRLTGKTGAEMEALTAVSVSALTLYDMCKAVDKEMVISNISLIEKTGGKSDFHKK